MDATWSALAMRLGRPLAAGARKARAARTVRTRACRNLGHVAFEVDAGFGGELFAQLVAQHARPYRFDSTDRQVAKLERPVADADQSVDRQPKRCQDVLDFAVLAFAQRHQEPDVRALLALERRLDRPILDAVDLNAVLELVELGLRDRAEGADTLAAEPAGRRQLQHALEAAVVGE
jgi:hypothetical protein